MYKAKQRHLQPLLITTVNDLPEKLRRRLDQSWDGTFYRETFFRIREELFKPMYPETPPGPTFRPTGWSGRTCLKCSLSGATKSCTTKLSANPDQPDGADD
jgi:hypothetical protein